jgi:hypothetical protein
MPELTRERVQSYLCKLHGQEITVVNLCRLGESPEERSIKKGTYILNSRGGEE